MNKRLDRILSENLKNVRYNKKNCGKFFRSKTPTIHVTETGTYPVLIDNPEVVVYNLLKGLKSSKPDLADLRASLKQQKLDLVRSKFTELQRNILKSVEDLLPSDKVQQFFQAMADCSQNFSFTVCLKDVLWPLLTTYYPELGQLPNFSNSTNMETLNSTPLPIETNVNTVKQGESTLTIVDARFIPLFPAHPESVIFNILKSVQMHTRDLPELPKKSLAESSDFVKSFSLRQRHILTLAEALLPEDRRSGFLGSIYDCNQKDSFLNCSRDVLFPKLAEVYPDFPKFPNFDKELNGPVSLGEIESFLKTVESRNFEGNYIHDSRLKFSGIDELFRLQHGDKGLRLRALIDNLPDSVYYDLYVKMNQCGQYSLGLSCAHDIVYPTLKQYYDVPGFNVDEYYPKHDFHHQYHHSELPNPLANSHHEVVCDDMAISCTLVTKTPLKLTIHRSDLPHQLHPQRYPVQTPYIPFGKLPNGSQIFKQVQDIWHSNIPSSVGEQ